jgi:hypothetical protein
LHLPNQDREVRRGRYWLRCGNWFLLFGDVGLRKLRKVAPRRKIGADE